MPRPVPLKAQLAAEVDDASRAEMDDGRRTQLHEKPKRQSVGVKTKDRFGAGEDLFATRVWYGFASIDRPGDQPVWSPGSDWLGARPATQMGERHVHPSFVYPGCLKCVSLARSVFGRPKYHARSAQNIHVVSHALRHVLRHRDSAGPPFSS